MITKDEVYVKLDVKLVDRVDVTPELKAIVEHRLQQWVEMIRRETADIVNSEERDDDSYERAMSIVK